MKKSVLFIILLACSCALTFAQSYNELFTTYRDVSTQPHGNKKQGNNNAIQYEVVDANKYSENIASQNVQIVNGIYIYAGQLYSVKLKVGVSGVNKNQIVVCGYWDGQMWNNMTYYVSPLGYDVPEQIKRACTYQVYIGTLGIVYF